jgi:hypothetical protein
MKISSTVVAKCLGLAAAGYTIVMMGFAAAMAVFQEWKIWKPQSLPSLSLWGCSKVFAFNIVWFTLCLLGSIAIVIKYVVTFGRSSIDRDAHFLVEHTVAKLCTRLFVGRTEIVGREHLPNEHETPAPVYIANHASQIDVAVVYFINRRFKWVAKQSVFYLYV